MKILIFISVAALISVTSASSGHLLGSKQCTWGPSYWCANITNAAGCRAVQHCIQTVWVHKKLPPDTSNVCNTCLEMVKEARDQLLSNETETEIQQVFDGSCDLIPIEIISKECKKVVDEFLPELIDTLASQMDPQVVCHVAGLCNNERYHELLIEHESKSKPVKKIERCEGCLTVLRSIDKNFKRLSRDQVLNAMIKVCGKMSSLSDACSNIVLIHFNTIYSHLLENLGSDEFCLLAGECSDRFHQHPSIEITPNSQVGFIEISENDDLPCELCEQLVLHLRDVVVANTTEDEFERVLLGICKQTKSFADECKSIVEEYYPMIYEFLTEELNGTVLCGMIGICPGPGLLDEDDSPIIPLVPVRTIANYQNKNSKISENVRVIPSAELAQLPIERLSPKTLTMIGDTKLCAFCEYLLHDIQQAITNPVTETKVEKLLDKECDRLPISVKDVCVQFVNDYGPAFAALLSQEIDPSIICPLLSVCKAQDSRDVEVFMQNKGDKPSCPLCLFAVTQLENELKNNKSKEEIKEELEKLCTHLSQSLREECDSFVNSYADHIIEAILANMTPQEVCVFLKLCSAVDSSNKKTIELKPTDNDSFGGDVDTNEIPDRTVNGQTLVSVTLTKDTSSPECIICEFVISEVSKAVKSNSTDEEIMNAVKSVCSVLPKTIHEKCDNFIDKYGEVVIALLQSKIAPQLVCSLINLCATEKNELRDEVRTCGVCRESVRFMSQIYKNPKISHDEQHVLEKTCRAVPLNYLDKCKQILMEYGHEIFVKIPNYDAENADDICEEFKLCHGRFKRGVLVGTNKCSWGPGYWCESNENAEKCGNGALAHCRDKVWKAQSKP